MAARRRFTMFATEKERSECEVKVFLMERIAVGLIFMVTASIGKQWPRAHIYDAHTWLFISLVVITYTMGPAFCLFRWLYTAVTGRKVSPWIGSKLFLLERSFLIACIPAAGDINNCSGESYSNYFGQTEKEHDNGNEEIISAKEKKNMIEEED
ncbi:hypothetical protein PIB30_039276 [Stylosanthes scabra]|uniref:Uncharacterized protein n=1 Tax=Stylosanthes scabra TaxID=79078 RepID=A0ABU6WH73_9FABA|nr:hypothetical protein [Stylosanthes scabra]